MKEKKFNQNSESRSTLPSLLTDYDIHLFKEGKHYRLHEKLGAHPIVHEGITGVLFAVWAPNAQQVSVIGDFNAWDSETNPMYLRWDGSGIWELFIPDLKIGSLYKYFIRSHHQHYEVEKGDPFARFWEKPPLTSSVVWEDNYEWTDDEWMQKRKSSAGKSAPLSIYEVHLGSWKREEGKNEEELSYRQLAETLPAYVKKMGFSHVELLPVMEHPFYGSWGYQTIGYYAPTSRYGSPADFKFLIDAFHQEKIGVILDWVPSHFPEDQHGLHYFDGTHLYEHEDPQQGYHPDWTSYIFNYGRNEVRSFLISNAIFWFEYFHIDGMRVDAVASMLHLDYSREPGQWVPNKYGGRENLEAISFLKELNTAVYKAFPDIHMIAEESTDWPAVSRPVHLGGLGFGMKWMMGWMHDTLSYFSLDPIYRKYHQNTITFSIIYAFAENFILPLSHDEVVHGKGSMINKMPGDEWQKFANLRALYSYMYAHPGGKLLFMGGEFGQTNEWNHDEGLRWFLCQYPIHQGLQKTVQDLNHLYQNEKALYHFQFEEKGFEWIDMKDTDNSVIVFARKSDKKEDTVVIICNFTPHPIYDYRIGIPSEGTWHEIFNSDSEKYGGSGIINFKGIPSEKIPAHDRKNSLSVTLAPLGVSYLKNNFSF